MIIENLVIILVNTNGNMLEQKKLLSVNQFITERGQDTLHPLVCVIDQALSGPVKVAHYTSDIYIIFLKDLKCEELSYGRNKYDYQDDTLLFIAPGKSFGYEVKDKIVQPNGWALAFDPELIKGTSLGKKIKEYSFFAYDANEALHLSKAEKQVMLECFSKILNELNHAIDKYSKDLIVNSIELFLNYCSRFYDRQFITRENLNKAHLVKFEHLIDDYFETKKSKELGLPLVSYFAEKLHLSANYFGDLVKKHSGKSAQEFIQDKTIELAKEKLLDLNKSISDVSYEMGFKYPQHFTRLFKQRVGIPPNEYRTLNHQ